MKLLKVLLPLVLTTIALAQDFPLGQSVTRGNVTVVAMPLNTKPVGGILPAPGAKSGYLISVSTTSSEITAVRIIARLGQSMRSEVVPVSATSYVAASAFFYSDLPLTGVVVEELIPSAVHDFN